MCIFYFLYVSIFLKNFKIFRICTICAVIQYNPKRGLLLHRIFLAGKFKMSSTLNPMTLVRETCLQVIETAKYVSIDNAKIDEVATQMSQGGGGFRDLIDGIKWDASGWHYSLDAATSGPLTCQYVFVLDALNFCFWPSAGMEYDTLAVSLKDALTADPSAFSATNLSAISEVFLVVFFLWHNRHHFLCFYDSRLSLPGLEVASFLRFISVSLDCGN